MALITKADLESIFTVRLVREVFGDDGGPEAGPRLAVALQVASDQAAAILGKIEAWKTTEALQSLVDEDAGVRHAVCKLAMAVGYDAKPAWHSGGEDGVSGSWQKQARQTLTDLVARATRSRAEPQAGKNTVLVPRRANARQFEFARRRGNGSSGGF